MLYVASLRQCIKNKKKVSILKVFTFNNSEAEAGNEWI